MTQHNEEISAEEAARLQAILDGHDFEAQCDALSRLCPCRSRCYDREIWRAILHAGDSSVDAEVRHRAEHAIDTLREHARNDPEAQELARWLAPYDGSGRLQKSVTGRITARDVPRLIEILEGEDSMAQCDALTGLCPCRNRVYDKEVWRAIFCAYEETDNADVRDKAAHAIQTLRERVRIDPRSQELVLSLASENATAAVLESAVPVWNPRTPRTRRGELPIPRFERSHRSKANKPR